MRTLLVTFVLLATVLAGCAEDAGPAEDEDAASFEDFEAEVTSDTGIIRGIVVSPAIVPIEGAKVTLTQTGESILSNADGAFVFGDLEPGSYFLEVGAVGYKPVQTSTEVQAGVEKPPVVKVLLDFDPEGVPFVTTIQWDGYIECSTSVVAVCGAVADTTGLTDDQFGNIWDLDPGMDRVQTEMVWDSTQPAGSNMFYTHRYGTFADDAEGFYTGRFNSTEGPSPLLQITHGEQAAAVELGVEEEFKVAIFSGAADLDPAGVAGVTVSQEFTIYMHVFYGYLPEAGWRFTSDGAPAPPSV